MGKKISPVFFRLFKNNNYKVNFFVPFNHGFLKKEYYKKTIEICLNLKNLIKDLKKTLNIITIKLIFKINNNIELNIILPYTKEEFNINNNIKFINKLKLDLILYLKLLNKIKIFKTTNIFIGFKILKLPFNHSKFIFFMINNKFKYRNFIVKDIFKYIFLFLLNKKNSLKGIKVCISGRIKGIDRAKIEVIKKGNIALQTINNKIDYYSSGINTGFGVVGIKIWLFKY